MDDKDKNAFYASIVFLCAGLGILWFTNNFLHINGEATYVSLLLLPVLVYMIMSDRIKQIRGPGGLEAVFNEPIKGFTDVNQPIEPSIQSPESVEKRTMSELDQQLRNIDYNKPVYMSIKIGNINYSAIALLDYIKRLSQLRNFKFVVFVDQNSKFVGYMPVWALRGILNSRSSQNAVIQDSFNDFMNIIKGVSELSRFSCFPGVITDRVYPNFTYNQALQKMTELNIEALVVLNSNKEVSGIVERDQLISKILLGK